MNHSPSDYNLPLGYRWADEDDHDRFDINDPTGWMQAPIFYSPRGIYRDRTVTHLAVLDERNMAILHRNLAELNARQELAQGHYVRFADDVMRRISHVWKDENGFPLKVQTSDGGSWHLGEYGMSFSGSLYAPVDADTLTKTNETRWGSAWFFHHDWAQAHNGVAVTIPLRVYECRVDAPQH